MRKTKTVLLALSLSALAIAPFPAARAEPLPAEMMRLRDPFKRPEPKGELLQRTELEQFPIERIRLVGIMTGPKRMRAMVQTPDGKTHFVAERAKIGTRKGVVTAITPEAMRVREQIVNVLGQEESVETDVLLPPDARSGRGVSSNR